MNDDKETPRPTVRTSDGQTDYKRELAYQCLGIQANDVQSIPFFAAQLRGIARAVRGADKREPATPPVRALDYLDRSEDPEARRVAVVYHSVPESYRRLLPPEAFCHAAGVSPWRVLEIVTVVAVRQGAQGAAIVAAVNHPRVVQKTVERALQEDGIEDRMVLHRALGFLPAGG